MIVWMEESCITKRMLEALQIIIMNHLLLISAGAGFLASTVGFTTANIQSSLVGKLPISMALGCVPTRHQRAFFGFATRMLTEARRMEEIGD